MSPWGLVFSNNKFSNKKHKDKRVLKERKKTITKIKAVYFLLWTEKTINIF